MSRSINISEYSCLLDRTSVLRLYFILIPSAFFLTFVIKICLARMNYEFGTLMGWCWLGELWGICSTASLYIVNCTWGVDLVPWLCGYDNAAFRHLLTKHSTTCNVINAWSGVHEKLVVTHLVVYSVMDPQRFFFLLRQGYASFPKI